MFGCSTSCSISWTEQTWNPVRGCTKISAGCKNCYACTFAERWRGIEGHPFEQGFDLKLVPHKLNEPLAVRSSKTIFVNSTSDLFHEDVPTEYIRRVADMMLEASRHTYQVLTKRSKRMRDVLNSQEFEDVRHAEHICWGVTVEDRRSGVPRIQHLRRTNVAHRFLSCEPLLEDLGSLNLKGIDWLIVGGESGPGARPFSIEWAEGIVQQCRRAVCSCLCEATRA